MLTLIEISKLLQKKNKASLKSKGIDAGLSNLGVAAIDDKKKVRKTD